jgi:signal transduction histidine kinase
MPRLPVDASTPGQSRIWLLAGFGGLLAIMAVGGIDAVHILREIQTRNDRIQREFVERSRVLSQLRSELYLSGTYVRDYLLEPDVQNATGYRADLDHVRGRMGQDLDHLARLTAAQQPPLLGKLNATLADYWQVLEPVFQWTPGQRQEQGYVFLRDRVFPRRTALFDIADQIARIDEQQLQVGNQLVAELFQQFRNRMVAALLIALGTGFFLAAFSTRSILRLERDAQAKYIDIVAARGELKELSARMASAQEDERRSISRELHDEVGQSLSAVLLGLSNMTAATPPNVAAQLAPYVSEIRRLTELSIRSIRNMSLLLRPSMLDDLGLLPALQWQARETAQRTGLIVHVAAAQLPEDLPEAYKTCIYRVVQEALHNVTRHAAAQQVRISVQPVNAHLKLVIQDDGRGFDPQFSRGLGLLGMEERVTHLGGTFEVRSTPTKGTLVSIDLPLENQRPV